MTWHITCDISDDMTRQNNNNNNSRKTKLLRTYEILWRNFQKQLQLRIMGLVCRFLQMTHLPNNRRKFSSFALLNNNNRIPQQHTKRIILTSESHWRSTRLHVHKGQKEWYNYSLRFFLLIQRSVGAIGMILPLGPEPKPLGKNRNAKLLRNFILYIWTEHKTTSCSAVPSIQIKFWSLLVQAKLFFQIKSTSRA